MKKKWKGALSTLVLMNLAGAMAFAAEEAVVKGESCTLSITVHDPVGMVSDRALLRMRAIVEARGYEIVEMPRIARGDLKKQPEFTLDAVSGAPCVLREGNSIGVMLADMGDLVELVTPEIILKQGDKPIAHHDGRALAFRSGSALVRLIAADLPRCEKAL